MPIYRSRAPVLNPVTCLTAEQHAELKRLGATREISWSTSTGEYGALIRKFRSEAKSHYYRWQRRRCCYCSTELQNHKFTYDAEHILDQSEYPEYVFEERNLAVVCKTCNQSKSKKPVSSSGARFSELSSSTADYSIVHPHHDEWNDYLEFDEIGRIVPVSDSKKGKATIYVCGIVHLNAARLADEFSIDANGVAMDALRSFHEISDIPRKQKLLEIIDEIALRDGHPGATAIIEALRNDMTALHLVNDALTNLAAVGAPPQAVVSPVTMTAPVKPEEQVEAYLMLNGSSNA